jgi:5-formyltetrahydrofolate cyclo-ligase
VVADKTYLRNVLKTCRDNSPASYVSEVSAIVQRRVLVSAVYRDADTVIIYAPKNHEIGTELIFGDARAAGRKIFFPKVVRPTRELALVRVDNLVELQAGAFGLLEPTGVETVPVANLRRALICVPGLAFSPDGLRLGRGGGYYDRLLAQKDPSATSAGLAYAFQVLDQLPQAPGDRRIDLIFTESALDHAGAKAAPIATWTDQGGVFRC